MAVPDNPPVVPSFYACGWVGPLNACYSSGPPYWDTQSCPPTIGGVVIAGYEDFTQQCDDFGNTVCWNPDLEANRAWQAAGSPTPDLACILAVNYPTCSKGWSAGYCDPDLGFEQNWGWDGECPTCPEFYELNPGDCLCYNGIPCSEGTCYCEASGDCVGCANPVGDCVGLSDCFWNPTTCTWDCVGAECPPDKVYDYTLCECVPRCVIPECWCEDTHTCVDCTFDPGPDEHNCVWNIDTCVYDCDHCPEGECWCESSSACVVCYPIPTCFNELHCEWDFDVCDWLCDDTETKCGPNRTWMGDPDCKCSGGGGGVWNIHIPDGHYFNAHDLDGIHVLRAEDTVPPFTLDTAVTADTADRSPRLVRNWDGRLILDWLRGTDVLENASDDEGESWLGETTIFTGATQCTIAKDKNTGLLLRAALVAGEVVLTRQYPGDDVPSAEFPAILYPGATALTLDDAGFHLSHAPEGPGRWLLVGVLTAAVVNYASSDEGETWLSVD